MTYESALELLAGNRDKRRKKLGNNTYLLLQEQTDEVYVEFHDVQIIHYKKDGTFVLNGIYTPTTRARIGQFTHFRPYVDRGYGFISTPTKVRAYEAGMHLHHDGSYVDDDEAKYKGDIDARDYFNAVPKFASQLARNLVYGKLDGWDFEKDGAFKVALLTNKALLAAVENQMYTGSVVQSLLQEALQYNTYRHLLHTLTPEDYQRHWGRPSNVDEEIVRYCRELMGGDWRQRPSDKRVTFKNLFIHQLYETFGLEEAPRSGWR